MIHYFNESEKLGIFLGIELLAFLWVISVDKLFFQVCIGNQVKAAKTETWVQSQTSFNSQKLFYLFLLSNKSCVFSCINLNCFLLFFLLIFLLLLLEVSVKKCSFSFIIHIQQHSIVRQRFFQWVVHAFSCIIATLARGQNDIVKITGHTFKHMHIASVSNLS